MIVLSNLGMYSAGVIPTGGEIAHQIVSIAATHPLGPEWPSVVPVPTEVLDQYVGTLPRGGPGHHHGGHRETVEFSREGGRLFATARQGRAEVYAQSTTTFYAKGAPVTFTFVPASSGGPASAVVTLAGVREYRLVRQP